jgi:hypothetical protein
MHHLERIGFQVGKNEEQAIFRRRKRTVLVHGKPVGGPRFPIETPRRQMRLVRGFKRRNQLLKLVEAQTGEIQELGGARLHIGESYTGHLWCLLSWEAEYTIIGINSKAYGLEIDEELVRRSRAIARRLGIPVTMLCTSFLPAGYVVSVGGDGTTLMTPASVSAHHDTAEARAPLCYDGMEIAIADIGVFFAYPWPEERVLIQELFEAVARAGALLVVYHTDTDIRVWRKVAGEGELEDPRAYAHRP